jgi:hypothetical protein
MQPGKRACQIRQKFYDVSGIADLFRHLTAFPVSDTVADFADGSFSV